MPLSREARLMCSITVLAVPTIMVGGLTLLSLLTHGGAGMGPDDLTLNATQWALWRAGHAHAGVWVILSLVLQMLIDATRLPKAWMWTARIGAPLAPIIVSAGFFGLAYFPQFRWLLYLGGLDLLVVLLLTGGGLLASLRPATHDNAGRNHNAS